MPSASLFTLGCKLNQFETACLSQLLENMGYEIVDFPSMADIYIINTCTVTAKSEYHSSQAVRRAIRANPGGIVVVTGCAAQVNPKRFASIPGVDLVIGNIEKPEIPAHIRMCKRENPPVVKVSAWHDAVQPLFPMTIQKFADYTRAFVKVQEGCDARCAYCIVPFARGPARSAPLEAVAAQTKGLWESGYKEIVLTGIHLGQYGRDLEGGADLSILLESILPSRGYKRIRLSSIEPNEFTPSLLHIIEKSAHLCHHFHIPLQSGSEGILKAMGRRYTPDVYREVILGIGKRAPDVCIGADVMVGFPGESEEDYKQTYKLVESLPLAYLHVFSYSPRMGTPAADMPSQVAGEIKKQRSVMMRRLGQLKRMEYRTGFLGMDVECLILNQSGPAPGYKVALSGNYLPVCVEAGNDMVNEVVQCRIKKATRDGVWGEITRHLE